MVHRLSLIILRLLQMPHILPEAGDSVEAGEVFGDVESVKAVSDVYSPVTGEVEEINEELLDAVLLYSVHSFP